jgi:hypothetical protein
VLFFQILQVPGADLEKVGDLGAGEQAVSHCSHACMVVNPAMASSGWGLLA